MNSFGAVVRIISDLEYKEVGGGLISCRCVHDTSYREGSALFADLKFWGKKGSAASQILQKGDTIFVSGNLTARMYKEKQYFDIEASDFTKVGGQPKSEDTDGASAKPKTTKATKKVETVIDEEVEAEIPF